MDDSLTTAFTLVGFLLAQVTSVLSKNPGEDLVPVAFVADSSGQRFEFFEEPTLEATVETALRELPTRNHDAWTFAYEGFITANGKRQSAFVVHAWVRGMADPIVVAQTWTRVTRDAPVALTGLPLLLPPRVAPQAGRTTYADPLPLSEDQKVAIEAGIARNKAVRDAGLVGGS